MTEEISYQPDLYRGVARDYDRFRMGYPQEMLDDLVARAGLTGRGRLLDLACGTGQITFAMQDRFGEVWAVDQEPDMVGLVRRKAATAGMSHVHPVVSAAEVFAGPAASFELVAIGNAFHRLQRQTVAASAFRWLEPGRCVALLWSNGPWSGPAEWQNAMAATLERWRTRTGAQERVPAGWERVRREHPDATILENGGFELVGSYSFPRGHVWTADALIGFVNATSALPRSQLGDLAETFERDFRAELGAADPAHLFHETIDFAYELARRPG